MIQQRLFIAASCLITALFFSCNNSDSGEKLNSLAEDSIYKAIEDPDLVTDDCDTTGTVKTLLTIEKINGLSELEKRFRKKSSYFVIKTNRDTVIKCKEGTLLSIPANAFLNTSDQSPVVGEVKISVKEFYKISDMMIQGLTTMSNGQLLESGGMINIKVISKKNKDSCVLKPGKNILIAMANSDTNNVDRMQLFNGVHGETAINWQPMVGWGGFAQAWSSGGNNLSQSMFRADAGFVFPDDIPKVIPQVVSSTPEDFQAEIKLPLRELLQSVGIVTKKANAYVDTSGDLHCYRFGGRPQIISFAKIYTPSTVRDIKVNLAVDVGLSYEAHLNHDYYQKLFKMAKVNPDSLIAITVTLNPTLKMTSIERVKKMNKSALTMKEYRKKERQRTLLVREYESRVSKLSLANENRLISLEKNATTNLQSAQNYLLLNTSQLGWINCDRFNNAPAKVDYVVHSKERASLLIVFKSMKSIMSSDSRGVFQGVPLDEKITIVGLKTENGKLMMAMHETSITEQPFGGLIFEPVTIKEYKNRLEKLNKI